MCRDSHRTVSSSKTRETPQMFGTEELSDEAKTQPPGEGCTAGNKDQAIPYPVTPRSGTQTGHSNSTAGHSGLLLP